MSRVVTGCAGEFCDQCSHGAHHKLLSLELDGTSVNSSSTKIIEAQPANVDWEVVYGSMEIRSEGGELITCT